MEGKHDIVAPIFSIRTVIDCLQQKYTKLVIFTT